jgi:regulation of enolase protein 1 (concanavalin A-like superfamily)
MTQPNHSVWPSTLGVVCQILLLVCAWAGTAHSGTITLNFETTGGAILDTDGQGTGFPTYYPGGTHSTKDLTLGNNAELDINTADGVLTITSQDADFNNRPASASSMVIPGFEISGAAGFDFSISATFTYPSPDTWRQVGILVADGDGHTYRVGTNSLTDSDTYSFTAMNDDFGADSGISWTGPVTTAGSITATLSRTGNSWLAAVGGTDVTTSATATLGTWFDADTTLYVGIFAHDPSAAQFTSDFDSLSVTAPNLVPEPSTLFLLAMGALGLLACRRLRRRR